VIAMMWGYYDGWSWLWMLPIMLLIWGAVIAVAIWAVRTLATSRNSGDAMDTLRRRLAAGEISQEDFEKTRRILQG